MKTIKITKNTANLSNQHNNNITPPPPQHNRHLGKNLVLLIGLLALPLFSQAQIIIDSAETTEQTLSTPNAAITVTEAGSIRTTADYTAGIFVESAVNNGIVINDGIISTDGNFSYGISSVADDVNITNNGTITTTGNTADGIHVEGADSIITVSGRVSATGAGSFAISGGTTSNKQTLNLEGNYDITGDIDLGDGIDTVNINGIGAGTATSIVFHNVETVNLNDPRLSQTTSGSVTTVMIDRSSIIINDAQTTTQTLGSPNTFITATKAGSIKTAVQFGHGILVSPAATNAIIINNGIISTTGQYANGINSEADDVSITNNGTITATNADAYGIYSTGANAIINHSGTITVTSTGGVGIAATGADSTITVSGRISSTGANSFAVSGGSNKQTLNLEGNYDIANGDIDLGDGIDTVNIDGVGAYTGTKTSIVFLNTEYIISTDYRVVEMGNDTSRTVTIDGTLPPPTTTVLLNNNGCTLNANTDKKPFDPTLPLLALLAGGYLLNRKLKLN